MYKVCITDYLSPPAVIEQEQLAGLAEIECLQATSEAQLIGRLDSADAIIVFHEVSLTRPVIETMKRCKLIHRAGAGVDNVDFKAAGERGVFVCNVPDYGVDEVADHAMALTLSCIRGLMRVERGIRQSLSPWDYRAIRPSRRLAKATMGIIGLGRIGTATALRAKAFKMRVLACDPYIPAGVDKAVGVELVDLPTLLTESDVVSLHVPLTSETRHMIDAAALAKIKPDAILVNTARGAVVDIDALAVALEEGRLGGAGVDVLPLEPPEVHTPLIRLWQSQKNPPVNLILTPHVAFYSEAAMSEMRVKAAAGVARVLRGEAPRNCVNFEYIRS